MYPTNPQIEITLQTVPLINRLAYTINGVENNPTLELVRGYTYRLKQTLPAQHQLWIKSALGIGQNSSYNLGVKNNGSSDLVWRVPETAPGRLVYQAYVSTEISGSILITDAPPVNSNGIDSYASLQQALDFLEESLSFTPKDIAGSGLLLTGSTLSLVETTRRYLEDTAGNLYTTQTGLTINDNPANLSAEPTDLQSWLNYLAALVRQIKGGTSYLSSAPTLLSTNGRIDNLTIELNYLRSKLDV
jgi:hypothetical protein